MALSETTLAQGIFLNEAREGVSGSAVSAEVLNVADDLRRVREEMHGNAANIVPQQVQPEPITSVDALPGSLREYVNSVDTFETVDLQAIENTLRNTAADVQSIVGGAQVSDLEDGVAGQAYQGVKGSSQIDVTSSVRENTPGGSIIDTTQLKDVVVHEDRHEKQAAQWNADVVEINLPVGQTIVVTRHAVSETDAMLVQSTVANVSADYRYIYQGTTGIFMDEQIRQTAQTGDLVGLKEEIEADTTQASSLVSAA